MIVRVLRGLRRGPHQRGAALVEFALAVPLLMMFLFGIIAFGVMLAFKQNITAAAAEGARAAVSVLDDRSLDDLALGIPDPRVQEAFDRAVTALGGFSAQCCDSDENVDGRVAGAPIKVNPVIFDCSPPATTTTTTTTTTVATTTTTGLLDPILDPTTTTEDSTTTTTSPLDPILTTTTTTEATGETLGSFQLASTAQEDTTTTTEETTTTTSPLDPILTTTTTEATTTTTVATTTTTSPLDPILTTTTTTVATTTTTVPGGSLGPGSRTECIEVTILYPYETAPLVPVPQIPPMTLVFPKTIRAYAVVALPDRGL